MTISIRKRLWLAVAFCAVACSDGGGGDDDAGGGGGAEEPCSTFDLTDDVDWNGTCEADTGTCASGYIDDDLQGTCETGVCCIIDTACADHGFICAADDSGTCTSGFWRQLGCPDDGYCCVVSGP